MKTKIKLICINNDADLGDYKFNLGKPYYMWPGEHVGLNNDGSEASRVTTGYYIFDSEDAKGYVFIRPDTYNKCFTTCDKWRELQLNTILDE